MGKIRKTVGKKNPFRMEVLQNQWDSDARSCNGCREKFYTTDMIYGPDPFYEDVNDDKTPVWLCRACYNESRLDI